MFRNFLIGIACIVAAFASPYKTAAQVQAPADKAMSEPHDYKVAYWFKRDNPLDTFQFKIYDATKGEYSPAVDQWLTTMKTRFPRHVAFIREYHATSEELADKVIGQLMVIVGPNLGYGLRDTNGLWGGRNLPKLLSEPVRSLPPVGSSSLISRPSATYLNPVTPPSPFPYPYTRPHP
jgi:hypothetical protein